MCFYGALIYLGPGNVPVCLKYNKNIYNVVQTGGGGAVELVVVDRRRTSRSQQDN